MACILSEKDEAFMLAAFEEAREALQAGEVPVGCVFVQHGVIIARGRNTVNATRNATRHAEINCIDEVLALSSHSLHDNSHQFCASGAQDEKVDGLRHSSTDIFESIDVYVTVEPCAMCTDALGQLRVRSVTFGCSNDRFGGCGSVVDVPSIYKYDFMLRKNVCQEKAVQLLKDFYKGENPNAPSGKAKRKLPSSKT
ncbi:tRNA-specific adenosine deaminase 2-like [Hyalella azteca]|uniref:tRNA-specific adenosine deaminase 2-like n=1 Tax=Hyalella azteca TaxID=294128 RepID=A0A8B7PDZ9_HYAAZ|nr:tRNA-specific adenosine deaminase 2-like [Hyalella azteca]